MIKRAKVRQRQPKATEQVSAVRVETIVDAAPFSPTAHFSPAKNLSLRLLAMALYIGDLDISVADLLKDERLSHLSFSTLQVWAAEDQWTKHRKEVYEKVRKNMLQATSQRLTQRMHHDVALILRLLKQSETFLLSGKVKPRSWEGVVKRILDLQARLLEYSDRAIDGIVDDLGHKAPLQITPPALSPEYDPEFLREVAVMHARRDRDALRAKLKKEAGNGSSKGAESSSEGGD